MGTGLYDDRVCMMDGGGSGKEVAGMRFIPER